jgi:hypothetical protein
MAFTIGESLLFGYVENLPPILNLPIGKVRVRIRNDNYAKVYVRNDDGIREFRLKCNEDYCYVCCEQGVNLKINVDAH